ncbi:2-amino-4-hydroxy-6-hydroxymethyldihydropteridine diphosphokinase [Erwinia psidii]|uniref:2-amino-4-hydroxy-6-hydroxymethyldihydropteridine pyrophosphokinase n=1 Tax=Erwinia psidii TaxID=69224 RepID=A0A3N6TT21_9GAMM|nr:2-amino-4-hydroxy-6-hydroxymethyldihydropteridine diphosphokinase [Erwinia psidii]MCX8957787.1 2-amino-4-hydroxy-6-hydroxymethyldihydropteridine diphosphokinase [Erwinia psidii]MCX8964924.1 2-amino-4-hydroxy-6-hydroxymethyldihydropteridine diphosphokinase [Erwinia psidii]RQM38402.1 2-amino-4-hydroxy-6-hydroxymethyldihydropteridine diphosphokinase [Erwinia psidii]
MNRVWLAVGSNLAAPLLQVQAALDALAKLPQTRLVATSSFWRTPPYGPADQPDYLNAAVALDSELTPEALLNHTQRIELEQGRVRKDHRWGPRTLDLDIMLFGNQTLNTPRLIVPHYDIHNRAFMLVPLLEIAPDITFPDGRRASDMLARLDSGAIQPW